LHLPNRDVTGVAASEDEAERARQAVPHGRIVVQFEEGLALDRTFDYIILADTINHARDVQCLFERLQGVAHGRTRLLLNFHNTAWRPLMALASALRLRSPRPAGNWLAATDVGNLLALAGWELVKQDHRVLVPAPFLRLDRLANRFLAPFLPWLCLTVFQVARPLRAPRPAPLSVSVVIPARNEAGNIRAAIRRLPPLGCRTEVIFVEGHSRDDTWGEIQRAVRDHPHLDLVALRQTGKGKGNAVREGFEAATGDVLMILDADLTVPPEELTKFYNALATGKTELANGVRLVYPMEKRAMRFLNRCANKLFGAAFTWVLGRPIKDTLCGTKALLRED
jgi:Glycosyl transferase family 2